MLDGAAEALRANEDVREFYLGVAGQTKRSFKTVKTYKRRKRWLAEGRVGTDERRSPLRALTRPGSASCTGEAHALARQLGDVDLGELRGPADLALIPKLAKIRGGRAAGRRAAVRRSGGRADPCVHPPVRIAGRNLRG